MVLFESSSVGSKLEQLLKISAECEGLLPQGYEPLMPHQWHLPQWTLQWLSG